MFMLKIACDIVSYLDLECMHRLVRFICVASMSAFSVMIKFFFDFFLNLRN